MQRAPVNGAASTQGHALLVGEARKMSAHEAACAAAGVTFVPIVMETLGGMSAWTCKPRPPPGATFGSKHFPVCPAPVSTMLYFSMEGKRRSMAMSVTSLRPLSGWNLLTFLSLPLPFLCVLCIF